MIDKRFQIGLCCPSSLMIDQVRSITSNQNIDLTVSTNALDEAVPDAKRMEASGAEILLADITTGVFLRENVSIPVVVFRLQTLDAMEIILKTTQIGGKILIPVLRSISNKTKEIANLIKGQIDQVVYKDAESVRDVLDEAKEQEYSAVIGGGFITEYAKKIGLAVIENEPSMASVQEAIDTANSIILSEREAREKFHRYRVILDSASDGVIAVSESGHVTEINRTACEFLKINVHDAIQKPVDEVLPKSKIREAISANRTITDSIEKIGSRNFVWNHRPFDVAGEIAGCVSTFNEVSSVIRAESKIRRTLSRGHVARYSIADLLHQCDIMKKTVDDARQFAKTDSNILITGETGTGKEVLVQSIHNLSARRKSPFVSINCAALPDQLLESELFGHEEGAFTGSRKGGKAGLFELAHKGTIFLDEIGETSQHVQLRLLRVLQEREIMRLGDDRLISIDVRVIAASNRDLMEEVARNNFRSDLFFRLNILRIHIPPLRSRPTDIPILVEEFIRVHSQKNGLQPFILPMNCLERLMSYPWPGNVRQLQNFAERLVLLSHSQFNDFVFDTVFSELIDLRLTGTFNNLTSHEQAVSSAPVESRPWTKPPETGNLKDKINQIALDNEKQILQKALENAKYSRTQAAKDLGISRSTLWKKLKKAGLDK